MGRGLIAIGALALIVAAVWLFVWLVKNPPASPALRMTVLATEWFAFAAVVLLGVLALKWLAGQI